MFTSVHDWVFNPSALSHRERGGAVSNLMKTSVDVGREMSVLQPVLCKHVSAVYKKTKSVQEAGNMEQKIHATNGSHMMKLTAETTI